MNATVSNETRFLHAIELGLGAWQWGDRIMWQYGRTHTDKDIREAFDVSIGEGIRFIDTAEVYGSGRSERLLGQFIKETDQPVVIATKFFPFPWRLTKESFPGALKHSLERLGVDKLDLFQLHECEQYGWDRIMGPRGAALGLQRCREQPLLAGPGREGEHARGAEEIRHRTLGTQVASVPGEGVAQFGDGAVAVVGHAADQHRDTAGAIPLVGHFLDLAALERACAPLDGTLEGIARHVLGAGPVEREAQPRIGGDLVAAEAGGHGQLADEPRECLRTLLVLGALAVLDVRPFAVASHALPARRGTGLDGPVPAELASGPHPAGPRDDNGRMIPETGRRPGRARDGITGDPVRVPLSG